VMEFIQGRIFRDNMLSKLTSIERFGIYHSMNEAISNIHQVDFTKLGLDDFGKSTGSFCQRQIERWKKYATINEDRSLEMDKLAEWLENNVNKVSNELALIHGDFKLENLIFHPTKPKIIAIIGISIFLIV
jgi:aminoglycoside phosphotransferase (APT) family kinase protein